MWERLSGAIASLPCLTIAALNGTLAGGAMGMVLACDLRIAVPGAKFFYPVMKLGFLPQPSDPKRLAALVVITSYSIHYTKLYDPLALGPRRRGWRRGPNPGAAAYRRIFATADSCSPGVGRRFARGRSSQERCREYPGCGPGHRSLRVRYLRRRIGGASRVITSYSIHYTKLYDRIVG